MENFDVAIVGAGPAGSSCAAFCALAGLRTVVLERGKFPREKVCGDCLNPSCWPANTMDSNNRHKLFRGEIFPAQEQPFANRQARKMPHSSIRPDLPQQLQHQSFPFRLSLEETVHSRNEFPIRADRSEGMTDPQVRGYGSRRVKILLSDAQGELGFVCTLLSDRFHESTAPIALARDLIPEQIDSHGLVSSNLPRSRHPVAHSCDVSVADWLACFRLLCGRRFAGSGEPCAIHSADFRLRGAARVWPRVRGEGFWD